MWKKDDATAAAEGRERETSKAEAVSRRTGAGSEPATIGPSITIEGQVRGDEDLLIQGRVEGSVQLEQQSVTVGREGRVKADVTARVVTVEGEVEGDLNAEEQVILRSSARVEGDITAPRVVLEDGARFRGLVDMGDAAERERRGSASRSSAMGRTPPPSSISADGDDKASEDSETKTPETEGASS